MRQEILWTFIRSLSSTMMQSIEHLRDGVAMRTGDLPSVHQKDHKRPLEPPSSREVVRQQALALGNGLVTIESDMEQGKTLKRKHRISLDSLTEWVDGATKINTNEKPTSQGLIDGLTSDSHDVFGEAELYPAPKLAKRLFNNAIDHTIRNMMLEQKPTCSTFAEMHTGAETLWEKPPDINTHGISPFEEDCNSDNETTLTEVSESLVQINDFHALSTEPANTARLKNLFEKREVQRMRSLRERNLKHPKSSSTQELGALNSNPSQSSRLLEVANGYEISRNDAEETNSLPGASLPSVSQYAVHDPSNDQFESEDGYIHLNGNAEFNSGSSSKQIDPVTKRQEVDPNSDQGKSLEEFVISSLRSSSPSDQRMISSLDYQNTLNGSASSAHDVCNDNVLDTRTAEDAQAAPINHNEFAGTDETHSQEHVLKVPNPSVLELLAERLRQTTKTEKDATRIVESPSCSTTSTNMPRNLSLSSKLVTAASQVLAEESKAVINWYPEQGQHLQLPKNFDRFDQKTQAIIREHETSKERKRDLEMLQSCFEEVARFGAVARFDERHNIEIEEVKDFADKVLNNNLSGSKKRKRIADIKDNFRRRRSGNGYECDPEEAEKLRHILWDQNHERNLELELVQLDNKIAELAIVRQDYSTSRHHRRKSSKRVRFRTSSPDRSKNEELSISSIPATRKSTSIRSVEPRSGTSDLRFLSQSERQRILFEERDARTRANLRRQLELYDEQVSAVAQEAQPNRNRSSSPSEISEENEGEDYNRPLGFPFDPSEEFLTHKTSNEADNPTSPVPNDHTRPIQNHDSTLQKDMSERLHRWNIGVQNLDRPLLDLQGSNEHRPNGDTANGHVFDDIDSEQELTDKNVGIEDRRCHRYLVKAMYKGFPMVDEGSEHSLGRYKSLKTAKEAMSLEVKDTKDLYATEYNQDPDLNYVVVKSSIGGLEERKLQFGENCHAEARIWLEKEDITISQGLFPQSKYRRLCQPRPWYFVRWKKSTTRQGTVQHSDTEEREATNQDRQPEPRNGDDEVNREERADLFESPSPIPLHQTQTTVTESDPRNDEDERSFTTIKLANHHAKDLLVAWLEDKLEDAGSERFLRQEKESIEQEVGALLDTTMYSKALDLNFTDDNVVSRTEKIEVSVYKRRATGPAN